MILFILAAGIGSRLFPFTKNTPKSLLELGDGSTLLERQIENALNTSDISEVVVITGYKSEQIEAKILSYQENIKITYLYNPFYDISNNFMSLWCTYPFMGNEDFIITNGDNIYTNDVYSEILNKIDSDNGIYLTIDYKDSYDEDDMKVILDKNNYLVRVHKDINSNKINAESVGLAVIKGEKERQIFVNKLISLSKLSDYRNKFWLEIFNSLVSDGVIINTKSIDKNGWREMDFHPDMEIIKNEILNNLFQGFKND